MCNIYCSRLSSCFEVEERRGCMLFGYLEVDIYYVSFSILFVVILRVRRGVAVLRAGARLFYMFSMVLITYI